MGSSFDTDVPPMGGEERQLAIQVLAQYVGLYRGPPIVNEARDYFSVPNQPLTPVSVLGKFHELGMDVHLYRGDYGDLVDMKLPCVTIDRLGRYVLLLAASPKSVKVVRDGEIGPKRMNFDRFESSWSGYWIAGVGRLRARQRKSRVLGTHPAVIPKNTNLSPKAKLKSANPSLISEPTV